MTRIYLPLNQDIRMFVFVKSELIEQISRERIIQIRIYRYNIVPDIPSGVPGLCCFMGYDSSS